MHLKKKMIRKYLKMSRISAEINPTNITPGFCPNCGSIFPQLRQSGNVICFTCRNEFRPEGKLSIFSFF